MKEKKLITKNTFDIGFLKVLRALQEYGLCANESQLQEYMGLGLGKIYEIKKGYRHVPKGRKSGIVSYFKNNYGVNPEVFDDNYVEIFSRKPTVIKSGRSKVNAGDMVYIERLERKVKELEAEITHFKEKNALLAEMNTLLKKQTKR